MKVTSSILLVAATLVAAQEPLSCTQAYHYKVSKLNSCATASNLCSSVFDGSTERFTRTIYRPKTTITVPRTTATTTALSGQTFVTTTTTTTTSTSYSTTSASDCGAPVTTFARLAPNLRRAPKPTNTQCGIIPKAKNDRINSACRCFLSTVVTITTAKTRTKGVSTSTTTVPEEKTSTSTSTVVETAPTRNCRTDAFLLGISPGGAYVSNLNTYYVPDTLTAASFNIVTSGQSSQGLLFDGPYEDFVYLTDFDQATVGPAFLLTRSISSEKLACYIEQSNLVCSSSKGNQFYLCSNQIVIGGAVPPNAGCNAITLTPIGH